MRRRDTSAATLPDDDSSRDDSVERLEADRERRMTALFRRFPALSPQEERELRELWDERMRGAKKRR